MSLNDGSATQIIEAIFSHLTAEVEALCLEWMESSFGLASVANLQSLLHYPQSLYQLADHFGLIVLDTQQSVDSPSVMATYLEVIWQEERQCSLWSHFENFFRLHIDDSFDICSFKEDQWTEKAREIVFCLLVGMIISYLTSQSESQLWVEEALAEPICRDPELLKDWLCLLSLDLKHAVEEVMKEQQLYKDQENKSRIQGMRLAKLEEENQKLKERIEELVEELRREKEKTLLFGKTKDYQESSRLARSSTEEDRRESLIINRRIEGLPEEATHARDDRPRDLLNTPQKDGKNLDHSPALLKRKSEETALFAASVRKFKYFLQKLEAADPDEHFTRNQITEFKQSMRSLAESISSVYQNRQSAPGRGSSHQPNDNCTKDLLTAVIEDSLSRELQLCLEMSLVYSASVSFSLPCH